MSTRTYLALMGILAAAMVIAYSIAAYYNAFEFFGIIGGITFSIYIFVSIFYLWRLIGDE